MRVERDLKVHLILDEEEARQVFLHLHPKYAPNCCGKIKEAIKSCLGYTPIEDY